MPPTRRTPKAEQPAPEAAADQPTEQQPADLDELLQPVRREIERQRLLRDADREDGQTERQQLAERFRPLRVPFPEDAIGKLPRKASRDSDRMIYLDYVGHAEVTNRLLEVDPLWNWEPVGFTPEGLPAIDRDGGLWIRLTVLGVSRIGYGHDDGRHGPDSVKKAVSDAIRNAAMRFGVALDLWSKSDRALLDAGVGVDAGDESGKAPRLTREEREAEQRLRDWNDGPRRQWEQRVHDAIGNREALTPLWYEAGEHGLQPAPVSNRVTGEETTLGALITWAGQQPAPTPPGDAADTAGSYDPTDGGQS